MSEQRRGFTLIEVLAVVLMTTLLLGVALDFYVDLSHQSARASDYTREVRRAQSLLDRVAADFERAFLVHKPEEVDPLAFPWVFVAESDFSEGGADRVKFVVRQTPRYSDGAASDLFMLAYMLRPEEDGPGYELLRWTSPGLPDSLDRSFPSPDDPDALRLASGIERFSLRFLNEAGAWVDSWDSSQLLESSELPMAVEIEVSLIDPAQQADDFAAGLGEPRVYSRQVQLPVRPVDLDTLFDPETYAAAGGGAAGEEGDENCRTVAECVDFSQVSGIDAQTLQALAAGGESACFEPLRPLILAQAPQAVDPSCR